MKIKAFTLAIAALIGSAAPAIERTKPVLLPDDGFGSDAAYGFMDYTDDACMFAGRKDDSSGRSIPVLWRRDNTTGAITATEMPLPLGFEGAALGWGEFPNGTEFVTGNLTDGAGNTKAVFWGHLPNGTWQMPQPLTNAVLDICGHEMQHGVMAAIAATVTVDGVLRPAIIILNQDLETEVSLLPSLAGGGRAQTIDWGDGAPVLGGYVTLPNGVRKPVVWTNDGSGYQAQALWSANNFGGWVYDVVAGEGGPEAAGSASRNGRITGFYTNSPGGGLLGLKPLEGYDHSAVCSISHLGDTGTHEIGHVIGYSWDSGGQQIGTGWIQDANGDAQPYNMRMGFYDWLETQPGMMRSAREILVDCTSFGNAVPSPGMPPQACILLPTASQVPDQVEVIVGQYRESDFDFLWQADGQTLDVRTQGSGGTRSAVLEMAFTPLSFTAGQDARMDSLFRTPMQVTGGTINVYFAVNGGNDYQLVQSIPATGGPQSISVDLLGGADAWRDPQSGQMRMRLEFKHQGAPRNISIETVEIAHEG